MILTSRRDSCSRVGQRLAVLTDRQVRGGEQHADALLQLEISFDPIADPQFEVDEEIEDRVLVALAPTGVGGPEQLADEVPHRVRSFPLGFGHVTGRLGDLLLVFRALLLVLRDSPRGVRLVSLGKGVGLGALGPIALAIRLEVHPCRGCESQHQAHDDSSTREDPDSVPLGVLAQSIERARRPRLDDLVVPKPRDVRRELRRSRVAPRPILLERLHHDPVQVTANQS